MLVSELPFLKLADLYILANRDKLDHQTIIFNIDYTKNVNNFTTQTISYQKILCQA